MNALITIFIWIIYILSLYFSIFWLVLFFEKESHITREHKQRRRLASYPLVSVLIPAYNEGSDIKETILSVLALDYPKDRLEVIVINDGSTDNTRSEVESLIKKTKRNVVLLNQKNQGKARSLNNALKIAKGDFFACLDADSFVSSHALKKMICLFQSHDDSLTIVTPSMRVNKPQTIFQKFQRVEYITAIFLQRLMGLIDSIYVAPGPFSVYRTDVIKKLGGFDVGNLTEDQEIAYRVQKHHLRIRQCYDAHVYTNAPHTLGELYKQRNRWFKGSLLNLAKYKRLIFNKEYGDFGLFQLPLNMANYVFSLASLVLFGYFIVLPLLSWLHNMFLIGFDFWPFLADIFTSSFSILNLDIGKLFVFYFLFALTVALFLLSHLQTNERIREHGVLYLIPYFFVYYIILSFISVIVLFELAVGKRQKW